MSDPIETHLSALREATHFQAPDPAVVRRRGDRLRRRNSALKVGGAALALTLLATPLLSLTRHGTPGEPTPADHGLTAGDALSLTELPERPELGVWEHTGATGPTLACVPARVVDKLGASETLERRYGADSGDAPATKPYTAQVRETVLEFPDPASAQTALATVTGRLRTNCAAPDLANPDSLESQSITGAGEGRWELYLRRADDACTECDAVYFDRQAALRVDDRLVLVSLYELGGPAEPTGLKASMRQLTTRAARRATTNVDASGSRSSKHSN
jgi:hypothetical protein